MLMWGRSPLPPEDGSHVPVIDVSSIGAIAWNVALFTVFAVHHSVFARDTVRRRVMRLVTPARERAFYVWVASALFIAVCALWQPVAGVAWQIDPPLRILLWALQALGAYLTVRSAAIIDIWVLSGVAQARAGRALSGPPGEADKPRPTTFTAVGPYGWVRHPIYTGWFLLVFAVGTMTATRLVFALVSCAYLVLAIPFEERALRASAPGAYDEYARQVRWKLFPGIY
jgi:protein-S-isoprenylcysteine O-methyltransferase Ste14